MRNALASEGTGPVRGLVCGTKALFTGRPTGQQQGGVGY